MSDNKNEGPNGKSANLFYLIILAIGIILVFTSSAIKGCELCVEYYVNTFIKELGFALIIAAILIFTVEKFSREEHQKSADKLIQKMNEKLFKAIFHRYIPEAVFREVDKSLLKADVYRTNYEIYYTLTNVPAEQDAVDHPRHVSCKVTSRYRLNNITDDQLSHKIHVYYELPVDEAWHDKVKVECVKIGGEKMDSALLHESQEKKDGQLVFSHDVILPKQSSVDVEISGHLLKRHTDMEVWSSILPSDGLKLSVNTPDRDIEVLAKSNHSEALDVVVMDETNKVWALNHGIFPYQSVVFCWSKKEK